MKKLAATMVFAATSVISGCGDSDFEKNEKTPELTPEQIQEVIDENLERINLESSELKQFVERLKTVEPSVVGARYAYNDGQLILMVALEKAAGGIAEYAVPITSGVLVGYKGAALADKLISYTFSGKDGGPDCDLGDLLEGDEDCRIAQADDTTKSEGGSSVSSNNNSNLTTNNYSGGSSFFFLSLPSRTYETRDSYQRTYRKDTKIYNEQRAKQTAREKSKEIQKKYQTAPNLHDVNKKPHNSGESLKESTKASPTSNDKAKAKSKDAKLSQSRQAFSTQRSTSRSSGMSSSGRGWGG